MLLMKQGEQAWLLSAGGGNNEFSRVFYFDGKYRLRDGHNRLGPHELVSCAVDEKGCHLAWSGGRKSHIPAGWYQVSWV
jgi:hypothetical protein